MLWRRRSGTGLVVTLDENAGRQAAGMSRSTRELAEIEPGSTSGPCLCGRAARRHGDEQRGAGKKGHLRRGLVGSTLVIDVLIWYT